MEVNPFFQNVTDTSISVLSVYISVFKEIYKYKQERDINITLEILVLTEHDCNLVNKAIDRKYYV